jgi:penicillin-binding protein-related factor A (putative recombinase)
VASKSNSRINNTGKVSETLFEEAMVYRGYVPFRLRDKADLHGLNKRNVAAFGQPSDYVVVGPKGAFFAEVKSSNNKTSFSLACFTRSQLAAMASCSYNQVGKYYRIFVHNMLEDTWYEFTADEIISALKSGVKSIKWTGLNNINLI